jgi:phage baseplate assembly protein V
MASNPILNRLANLISRVVLSRVDDSKKMQAVQLTALGGETRENVERVQNYGFTSVPQPGAEGVAVFVGGYRDHGLVVAMDDRRYRLTGLQAGEVAIYTDQGDKVVIERGGTIRVTASTKVVVAAPLVELAGSTHSVAKGEDLNTAISTLAGAIGTAVSGIPTGGAAAGAAITTAVGIFNSSAAAALSTKVKLS